MKVWVIHLGSVGDMGSKFQEWYLSTCTARLGGNSRKSSFLVPDSPSGGIAPLLSGGTTGDLKNYEAQGVSVKVGHPKIVVCRILEVPQSIYAPKWELKSCSIPDGGS